MVLKLFRVSTCGGPTENFDIHLVLTVMVLTVVLGGPIVILHVIAVSNLGY